MADLSRDELIHLLIYGALALYFSLSVVRLFRGRFVAALVTLCFWVAAFGAVITGYSYRDELTSVAGRVMGTVVPGLPIDSGGGRVTILRSMDGEFVVKATSGANHLTFIFDTGASAVVLKAEDAMRLGIDTRRLVYDAVVNTANGRAMTAEATLPELAIGSVRETNIPILVAKAGTLHENLLGMTFLDRLASFSVAQNRLTLQQ